MPRSKGTRVLLRKYVDKRNKCLLRKYPLKCQNKRILVVFNIGNKKLLSRIIFIEFQRNTEFQFPTFLGIY